MTDHDASLLRGDGPGPLDQAGVSRLIREATFGGRPTTGFRLGVEAELLPIDRQTRRIVSIEAAMMPVLRSLAADCGWEQAPTAKGAPLFQLPGGGRLTFEPGGQIEYAAPPFRSPSAALANLRGTLGPLNDRLADAGIDLYGLGIDPFNRPADSVLQVRAGRYRMMDAYYAKFGAAGARMMRQTAAIQLNVDPGGDGSLAWRVLNALAPVLVAMFANSRTYAGRDSGFANFRAHTWQALDRTRTGLPWAAESPDEHYADFALDAPAMFLSTGDGEHLPFREWISRGVATPNIVAAHISTLFPEVRPRRYFEVRSIDGLPVATYAAPVMLIAGLTMDNDALNAATEILGAPDTAWLPRAARVGLRDAVLASRAGEIATLAIRACRERTDLCDPADVDAAEQFFDRFTGQGRSPADDADAVKTAATAA